MTPDQSYEREEAGEVMRNTIIIWNEERKKNGDKQHYSSHPTFSKNTMYTYTYTSFVVRLLAFWFE